MPNFRQKKIAFFLTLVAFFIQNAQAQENSEALNLADSLAIRGQAERAYPIYRGILKQRQASPRMLLRMAATQESHNYTASALYYLSLYQARYPTWAVWRKMVEMAQTRQLTGYPSTWQQQLMVSVRRYYPVALQ